MTEVRLENVTKYYGRKLAVDNISFICEEGEFFSVLGPTGAGKSTILKIIAGIETITSGKILFNGHLVNNLPPYERNLSMAFETYNLYSHFNVYENIAFTLRAPKWKLNLSKEEEQKKVIDIAKFLGIDVLLDRKPQNLSGGQKQRVSLARALVRQAQVYLLDEPIAHLDAKLKFSTQTLLREFAIKYGSTIIYVTHDYREALALSDKMIVLRNGKIEQIGTPEEIYYNPKTDFVGLSVGEPPMNIIDGEFINQDGKSFFKADDYFTIELEKHAAAIAEKAVKIKGSIYAIRLGIRCEYIKIGKQKISENSFQLPIYSIIHESESSIITFELANTFLFARVGRDKDSNEYSISDIVWLDFDPKNVFFYEKTMELSKI